MKEMETILREAARLAGEASPFALATVVKVEGSAYRRPGARMLVDAGGQAWGQISGGCLEGETIRHALRVLETGRPEVVVYEAADDDPALGLGGGCGGTIHVLVEPAAGEAPPVLSLLGRAFEEGGVLVTVIASEDERAAPGAHLLRRPGALHGGDALPASLRAALDEQALRVLEQGRGAVRRLPTSGGEVEALFELVRPPVRLVLFGGGQDVRPLVHLGRVLGWRVTVVSDRAPERMAERFSEADERIFLMHPDQLFRYVPLDERCAAVVMEHSFLRDRAILGELLKSRVCYLGVLGPRRRTDEMLAELGVAPAGRDAQRLHAPVGLDVGAETPEEIALSIAAEVQAALSGRPGGPLRARSGAIHEPFPVT